MNSSYTPNTGCRGVVTHRHTYGNTRDNCGGTFESDMNNPLTGGAHKRQPPHGAWFMVDRTARRRHYWYCRNSRNRHDCGGGNCMQVWHHSRRRFPVNCGACTCNSPRAIRATVCLVSKYEFAGGSSGWNTRQVHHSVGTSRASYTSQETVHSASVAASGNIQGVIPSIGGTFGVSAETRASVTSAFSSAFSESRNEERNVTETMHLNMAQPVYIYHAQNHVYFEDGSAARLSGRTVIQFNRPVQAGCQQVWTSR